MFRSKIFMYSLRLLCKHVLQQYRCSKKRHNTPMHCCSKQAKKCVKPKRFYRANEMALWLKLFPKYEYQDPDEVNVTHDLDYRRNTTTFEEPQRLIEDFYHDAYYRSPMSPVPTLYWKSCQPEPEPEDDIEMTTFNENITYADETPETTTHFVYTGNVNREKKTRSVAANKSSIEKSAIPLSIVVAVGCALILLNLLIFAGMYYHRERIRKLREVPANGSDGDAGINRNNDRNISRDHITYHGQDNDIDFPKLTNMNHKPHIDSAPAYSSIAKPVAPPKDPGGYTYSALSQKSSPLHTHNHVQYTAPKPKSGPPSEAGSHTSSIKGLDPGSRQPDTNRSPKMNSRQKPNPRAGQQVTSNNAITIV